MGVITALARSSLKCWHRWLQCVSTLFLNVFHALFKLQWDHEPSFFIFLRRSGDVLQIFTVSFSLSRQFCQAVPPLEVNIISHVLLILPVNRNTKHSMRRTFSNWKTCVELQRQRWQDPKRQVEQSLAEDWLGRQSGSGSSCWQSSWEHIFDEAGNQKSVYSLLKFRLSVSCVSVIFRQI